MNMSTEHDDEPRNEEAPQGNLRWDPTDGSPGRWQCDGHGIHAGNILEIEIAPGQWVGCRIESADSGRRLIAYFGPGQLLDKSAESHKLNLLDGIGYLRANVNTHTVRMRWPKGDGRSR